MDEQQLNETAAAIVAEGKGILAADESDGTIKTRFDSIGIDSTEEHRRAYRDLLFTTDRSGTVDPMRVRMTAGRIVGTATLVRRDVGPIVGKALTETAMLWFETGL